MSAGTAGDRSVLTTREQRWMRQAYLDVSTVNKEQSGSVKRIYGGLCHKLPVLIRAAGLCQAVAYFEAKASTAIDTREAAHNHATGLTNERSGAYDLILEHLAEVVGTDRKNLLNKVQSAGLADYMHQTRSVLGAWFYYRRFAMSILGVMATDEEEGDDSVSSSSGRGAAQPRQGTMSGQQR